MPPLTCALEPVHGVRGPRPQEAPEVSLGRIPGLHLPVGLSGRLASKVQVGLPGSVLLPLWGHQSGDRSPEAMRDRVAPNSPASQRPPGGAGRHREQTPSAFRKLRTVTDARPHLQPGRWERIRPQENCLSCGNLARPFKAAPTRWGACVQRPQPHWCFSNENGDRGSAPREPGSLKGCDGVAFHFSQRQFSWDPSF